MSFTFNWTRIQQTGFFRQNWGQAPCVIRNALPPEFDGLTPEELAGLSLEEQIESRIILQHGPQEYELRRGPFTEEDYAQLPEQNWTLLVQGVDRVVPAVQKLLSAFDFIPYWRLDDIMVSYAVTGGNVGPHYDHYHVFLYQMAGKRRWKLTSKQCTPDNYIEGLPLRLMRQFPVELEYEVEPGDVLYIPPLWGHHGVALDDDCLTASIGYRSLRAREIIEALADWLATHPEGEALFADPVYQGLPPGQMDNRVDLAALAAIRPVLQAPGLSHALAQMMTSPDQAAVELMPTPLESPITSEQLPELLETTPVWLRDSVTRMALTEDGTLFVNGSPWETEAGVEFRRWLSNQIVYEDAQRWLHSPAEAAALRHAINQQWLVPDEE
ncbi:MAG TPA: cupin domain-containing protein [Sulfurivirga caldicuralii]|nr:cupin domain-containing protein [Sulfurivirga caldicuralii]